MNGDVHSSYELQTGALTGNRRVWFVAGACAVLLGLIVRSAWVAEDAYITLRTVDNWVGGYGLRWNIDERVQTYTHPLWMFALSAGYFLTREAYLTTIALGVLTTCIALALLIKLAKTSGHALAALFLIGSSRAFVDFSTSGLENPLAHALIALFVWQYAVRGAGLRRLAAIGALLALNRLDSVLIIGPALLHAVVHSYRARGLRNTAIDALIGLSPCLLWELFSLFYYGFLFPNTAYAKLNTDLPVDEVVRQGVTYVLNTLAWDLPLAIAIGLALMVAFGSRRLQHALLAAGVLLYVLYVVRIGGDFMIGRFLTMPLFAAGCLVAISQLPLAQPNQLLLFLVPFLWLSWHPDAVDSYPVGDFHRAGIADERNVFRDNTSLMLYTRGGELPTHSWVRDGRRDRERHRRVVVTANVGLRGFYAGPTVHYVDTLALTDPLLARLPAVNDPNWRVGHYGRNVPEGYLETLELRATCRLQDRALCVYFAKLDELVAGDLWSWSRLGTIVAMNLGRYDRFIDRARYRYPHRQQLPLGELSKPVAEGTPWNDPAARAMNQDGVELSLSGVSHATRLDLMLDGDAAHVVELKRGGEVLDSTRVPAAALPDLRSSRISIPARVAQQGFDRLFIRPLSNGGHHAVAHARLE
jgi:arabinofuranosyltransferase